tara:strand:+ start:827 stop:2527 length:1701 start_codon:yes stop_codon:yes gene_type:complete
MKNLFTILALILTSILSIQAQVPQGFNYQATVRNAGGELIVNQDVNFKFNIQQGAATSEAVYTETHIIATDDLGQINLTIGDGTAAGDFSLINWSLGSYFLGIQLDTGAGYVAMGTTQLLSVPYALYAENSGSSASDLQGVIALGAAANMVVSEANLSGIELSTIGGDTADNSYTGISSSINGTNGTNVAANGESNGINLFRNYGFRGVASNAQNLNSGVQGIANSETGNNYAVWGIASNADDGNQNRGVMGYATSPTVTGKNYGVTGWVGGSEAFNIALGGFADAANSTDGSNYGVWARASAYTVNGTNYGVKSEARDAPINYGVLTTANGTSGANYGIHASASGGELNYAGYFVGDVVVTEGTLTADIALASAPTEEMDAANKGYVDQVIAELRNEIQLLKGKTLLIGSWKLASEAGSLKVGPSADSGEWYSNSLEVVTGLRACQWDDEFVFGADGSFQNILGADTFLEAWQGVTNECGAPVAPHDGTATATYTFDVAAGTITINGTGAFLGLSKVVNGAELTSPADATASITYMATLSEDGNTLDLYIEAGPGVFWTYKLVKQ